MGKSRPTWRKAFLWLYHGCSQTLAIHCDGRALSPIGEEIQLEESPQPPGHGVPDGRLPVLLCPLPRWICRRREISTKRLSRKRFFPDEDFIALAISADGEGTRRRAWSVRDAGNVPGPLDVELGVPRQLLLPGDDSAGALSRYCIFDPKARPALAAELSGDPSINLMNYSMKGEVYRRLVAWMFGDRKVLPMVAETKEQIEFMQDHP